MRRLDGYEVEQPQKPSPVEGRRVQLQRALVFELADDVGLHFGDGRLTMPTTSRSPTMAPRALTARACGVSRSWETTIGGAAMPRTLRMKSELVPLPAPGAPPSRINSLGKRIRLRPNSRSSSRQTATRVGKPISTVKPTLRCSPDLGVHPTAGKTK